jgi:AcrR family transcriptional regulator
LAAISSIGVGRLETVSGPKQARSERTLLRLLEAAEELIDEKGLTGLSIPEVARRAGSSVGGFYARFRDKNELLRALEERFFLEVSLRLDALADERRWLRTPVGPIVDAAVEELVSVTEARRHLINAFLFRATQDTEIRDHAVGFRRSVSERITALVLAKAPRLSHPDPALAIDLGVQVAFALMQQHVLLEGTHAAGRRLSPEELRRELARLFVSYVGLDESGAPPRLASRARNAEPRRKA